MNIQDCIKQIEYCEFACEGGPLKLNVGYIELKARIAELEATICRISGGESMGRIALLEAENQRLQPLADDNEAHFVELKAVAEAALKHTRRYSVDDLDTYAALIDALHAAGYIYAGTVPKPSRDSGSTNENGVADGSRTR